MATGGKRGKAVDISRVQMIERIFAAADIERVAIGQKRLAAALFDKIDNRLGQFGRRYAKLPGSPK